MERVESNKISQLAQGLSSKAQAAQKAVSGEDVEGTFSKLLGQLFGGRPSQSEMLDPLEFAPAPVGTEVRQEASEVETPNTDEEAPIEQAEDEAVKEESSSEEDEKSEVEAEGTTATEVVDDSIIIEDLIAEEVVEEVALVEDGISVAPTEEVVATEVVEAQAVQVATDKQVERVANVDAQKSETVDVKKDAPQQKRPEVLQSQAQEAAEYAELAGEAADTAVAGKSDQTAGVTRVEKVQTEVTRQERSFTDFEEPSLGSEPAPSATVAQAQAAPVQARPQDVALQGLKGSELAGGSALGVQAVNAGASTGGQSGTSFSGQGADAGLFAGSKSKATTTDTKAAKQPRGEKLAQSEQEKVVEKVKELLKNASAARNGNTLVIRLDPPKLGSMTMRVTHKDGQVYARIVPDSQEVEDTLRNRVPELMQVLSQAGMRADDVHVSIGHERTESEMFQFGEFFNQSGFSKEQAKSERDKKGSKSDSKDSALHGNTGIDIALKSSQQNSVENGAWVA
jgi:flagellar hook-length control protein FliK